MIEIYNEKTIQQNFYTSKLLNRNIEHHLHSFWEITYCIDGEITHWVNDQPIKTHALSEILLIKPKDTHRITKDEDSLNTSPTFHRDIYVTPEKMKRCCDFLSPTLYKELLKKDFIILDGKQEYLETWEHSLKVFKNYSTYLKNDIEVLEKIHTSVVFQILSIYFKKFLQKTTYPAWINSFFTKLKSESCLCQSVEAITKEFNYSHAYLCREFKKHTGKTMVQCLNESRIIYSTLLLLDPKVSILEIAMRLNYSSQSAYCNAFKEIYNMSPKEWQKVQLNS
ncbi:MAG: helix-turn-helix domain-containing protein [Clostridiales bacterium]|nr:helix-turn-helix domain-containing protein [Clostridiales bacterium]